MHKARLLLVVFASLLLLPSFAEAHKKGLKQWGPPKKTKKISQPDRFQIGRDKGRLVRGKTRIPLTLNASRRRTELKSSAESGLKKVNKVRRQVKFGGFYADRLARAARLYQKADQAASGLNFRRAQNLLMGADFLMSSIRHDKNAASAIN